MPQDQIDLSTFSDKDVLRLYMPSPWPVEVTPNNEVVVPWYNSNTGVDLKFTLSQHLTSAEVDEVLRRLRKVVDEVNRDTKTIQAHSQPYQTTPTILMASPRDWELFWFDFCHAALTAQMQAAGAHVVTPKRFEYTDGHAEVWVRDSYILAPDGTALFRKPMATRPDKNKVAEMLQEEFGTRGIPIKEINSRIEGGDIIQDRIHNTVFVGVPLKDGKVDPSYAEDAKEVAQQLGMKLRLVPKAKRSPYYHLDTFMGQLPDGSVVLIPEATNGEGLANVRAVINKSDLLELHIDKNRITRDNPYDPYKLATNLITVNQNVFTTYCPPAMKQFIENRGYHVVVGPYQIADSGPHCQINFIKVEPVNGKSDVTFTAPIKMPYVDGLNQNDIVLNCATNNTSTSKNKGVKI